MADQLLWQNLSTVQSGLQAATPTIASAATIAPTNFITKVSGTTSVVTVTPPMDGIHMLVLIPTGAWAMTSAGNLVSAMAAATANQFIILIYDPVLRKYYNGKVTSA